MKILLLSTYYQATNGGATLVAYRLFNGLRAIDADMDLLVQRAVTRQPGLTDLGSKPLRRRLAHRRTRNGCTGRNPDC